MAPHATEDNLPDSSQDSTFTSPPAEPVPSLSIENLDLDAFHNFPEPPSPKSAPKDILPVPTRYPETLGSLIEIRESEGKGLGIFAIKDIPPGTVLLCEIPMLVMDDDDDIESLFNNLDLEKQRVFLSLASNMDDETAEEKSEQELSTMLERKLDRVVSCNAFSIAHAKAGIFETASRINHSCVPNSCYRFRESIGRLVIWNRWKLMDGEEVSIDYGHGRRTLKGTYGFDCDCGVCGIDESEGET